MRLSRHEQAHGLTVRRLDRVDSHCVSPFEGTFGPMTYQKYTPPDSTLKPILRRSRYGEYIISRTRR